MSDPMQMENQFKIEPETIAFIFNPSRDIFPAKPYYEDGNPEMYSQANKDKRQQLKTNPVVIEAINSFVK
jgi:hypothetical protein